jgi:benzoylformate decarboxylase
MAKLVTMLEDAKSPAIVAGDDVARTDSGVMLEMLAEKLGAGVWFEGLRARNSFPTDHPCYRGTLAFDAPGVAKQFAGNDLVLLLGGPFFEEVWYAPGSPFPAGCKVLQIEAAPQRLAYNFAVDAGVLGHIWATLDVLHTLIREPAPGADKRMAALEAQKAADDAAQKARVEKAWARSPTSMARCMAEIKAGCPGDVVVVDETITANLDLFKTFTFKAAGDYYSGRGGGIGQGVAGALGVAVAEPARPILCLSGDGSSMYSIQALWTAAHHDLPIVFVILANREYRVLKHNIDAYRARFDVKSNKPYAHMDLTGPVLGFVDMAKGMGVAGTHVTRADDIRKAVAAAFASGKPHLIEIEIEGKR